MLAQRSHGGLLYDDAMAFDPVWQAWSWFNQDIAMSPVLPRLDTESARHVLVTLSRPRLSRYLQLAGDNLQQALKLYILNSRVSAAFLHDLHFVEVALRNKFDAQLVLRYGQDWYARSDFLSLINGRGRSILLKAQRDAARGDSPDSSVSPGKVIAELSFGFWLQLTDAPLEHGLWVPCLHRAFAPRRAPKRSVFNARLEVLRQLRNRIAHHEPVLHWDLPASYRDIQQIGALLCPHTA